MKMYEVNLHYKFLTSNLNIRDFWA